MRRSEPCGELDVDCVVDRIGRGQALTRLPRRPRATRVPLLVIVIDRAERLAPLWWDQYLTYRRLVGELGRAGIELVVWKQGPPRWRTDAACLPKLSQGDALLVLGDLGLYADAELRDRWLALGQALARRGVEAHALVPCAASRWPAALADAWQMLDAANPSGRSRELDDARAARRLLARLSWTVRLEPELLREVAACLPADAVDVHTELEAWNLPGAATHSQGLLIEDALWRGLQADLRVMLTEPGERERMRVIVELVRRRHAHLPREIWHEEVRTLDTIARGLVDEVERANAMAFTAKVCALFEHEASLGEGVDARGWVERSLGERVPRPAWRDPEWGALLCRQFGAALEHVAELPPGLEEWMIPRRGGRADLLRNWQVRQRGEEFVFAEAGVGMGSLIAILPSRRGIMTVADHRHRLQVGQAYSVAIPDAEEVVLATECMRVRLRFAELPDWAHAGGRDRFGLWAAFRVGAVEQRMRWIPPGRFTMGSPEGEVGRYLNEGPQHEVSFEEGFWMAATPCTQALWLAVMPKNPSSFQSPRRPVEEVSCDDVSEFLGKLGKKLGIAFVLPSEPQWEYACRAGTTTATWVGDLDLRGENDAPILDRIAWYGGNSGVGFDFENGHDSSNWPKKQYPHTHAGSRDVATRAPNPWGLFDMLGNVWEWCADEYHPYDAAPVGDPDPTRVIRGGSWSSDARDVRAAHQYRGESSYRYDDLGFRLVLGPGSLRQDQQEKSRATRKARREQGMGTGPASSQEVKV
ncbi:SUMF1/EgtB/PvdO family nonheme iron enzyme [Nannocystaceae bacterium ST9]